MNIFQIEAFMKTIEIGSMTKAAECLFISQSTLSDRISKLEKELGFDLFIRGSGSKGVSLTDEGKDFILYAKKYLSVMEEIKDWKLEGKSRTVINFSGPNSINNFFLIEFFKKYLDNEIKLNISSHWNQTIYNMLSTYELDLGLVSRPFKSPFLKTSELFYEQLVLVYNSKFSDYSSVKSINELNKKNEINLDWGPDYELWCQKHWNINEVPKITVDSAELLKIFLQSKDSWAVMPVCVYYYLKESDENIKKFNFDIDFSRKIYIVSQKYTSDRVEYLKSDLINFLKTKEKAGLCKLF